MIRDRAGTAFYDCMERHETKPMRRTDKSNMRNTEQPDTRAKRSTTSKESESDRDDRVLVLTRWTGAVIAPILVVATVMLYGFPDRTTELFAWTINPEMTAIVMGAGYGTGAYYFYRVATADRWHRVGIVLPGVSVFLWFMLAATALHWENFNHAHPSFWAWTIIYAIGPFIIPAVWVQNNRTDPRNKAEIGLRIPRPVGRLGIASGVVIIITAVLLFVGPQLLIENWAWALSPLTARVLLGWFALLGVVNLAIGLDGRWTAARIGVKTQVIGFSLLLIGVVRAWGNFDTTTAVTWAFLSGFVLYLLGILALYYAMENR